MLARLGLLVALMFMALISSCKRRSPVGDGATRFRSAVGGGEWVLVELYGQPAAMGAGGRPATLRFEGDSARAGGFAGCNRYSGSYTVRGDSLRFAPLAMTKMACAEGMTLEQRLAEALDETRRYEVGATGLTLHGTSGKVARFERRG
jgi:heat shock protein HslJ